MSAPRGPITFFFGLGSRYSYLAATQIAALESESACPVTWRPLLSTELMQRCTQNPFATLDDAGNWSGAAISATYTEKYRQADLARWANYYGVAYHEPRPSVIDAARRTLYCVAAATLGAAADYARGMFDLVYVRSRAVTESDCRNLGIRCGLAVDQLTSAVDDGSASQSHERTLDDALAADVFGVPTFLYDGQLYFGNDRIVLLRHVLAKG